MALPLVKRRSPAFYSFHPIVGSRQTIYMLETSSHKRSSLLKSLLQSLNRKKNIESLPHIMPIRGNLAAKHGIAHSAKLISLVFQQAGRFMRHFIFFLNLFTGSVRNHIKTCLKIIVLQLDIIVEF
jgi:hypothetical protein